MEIYVINLERREDRLANMAVQLTGYDWIRAISHDATKNSFEQFETKGWFRNENWFDPSPLLNRPLNVAEMCCAKSHFDLWRIVVDSNEPAVILEDDVSLQKDLDLDKLKELLKMYDLVYLGYREYEPSRVVDIDEDLVKPCHPLHASSYCLSVDGAKKLLSTDYIRGVIPVDVYLAIMSGLTITNTSRFEYLVKHIDRFRYNIKLNVCAYKESIFQQEFNKFNSDITPRR